jgi:hypothetical protein
MSADPVSSVTKTVYVHLVDEGTIVVRPTQGVPVGGGAFRLLPTPEYDPDNETWQFPPRSLVRCENQTWEGHEILVAIELATGD